LKQCIICGGNHGRIPVDTPQFAASYSSKFFLPLENFFRRQI